MAASAAASTVRRRLELIGGSNVFEQGRHYVANILCKMLFKEIFYLHSFWGQTLAQASGISHSGPVKA
jgi:hypothetical protein